MPAKLPGQEKEPLVTSRLKDIKLPTQVVAGDSDYFIHSRFSKMISDRVPGAKYAEELSGGRIPFIEKPEDSAKLVLEFIQRLDNAQA